MQINLNGKPETLDRTMTVAELLDSLKLAPVSVAVEINEDIVSRKCYAETMLREGDRVEIVTFVGGG